MEQTTVMARMKEHWTEALTAYNLKEWQPVALCLQGSQNYGLDIEGSDVDTKFSIAPTFKEISLNYKPLSTTHIRPNEEHTDMKDVRLMLKTLQKQNINFVEILFTDYKIVNPLYQEQWDRLVRERELIARLSPFAALKTMKGVCLEKYHAMEHPYPSKLDILAKYGYDGKQLHHLLRVKEFIERYIDGAPYEECLRPHDPEYLKSVKQFYYGLDKAREVATTTIEEVVALVDNYCNNHECTINEDAVKLLEDVTYKIMEIAVKREFEM